MDNSDNNINDKVDDINEPRRAADKEGRTSDIYERFITRVQGIDRHDNGATSADKVDDNTKNINKKVLEQSRTLAGFEPLSDEELSVFLDDEVFDDQIVADQKGNEPDIASNDQEQTNQNIQNDDTQNDISNAPNYHDPLSEQTDPAVTQPALDAATYDSNNNIKSDTKRWRIKKSAKNTTRLMIIGAVIALAISAIFFMNFITNEPSPHVDNITDTPPVSTQQNGIPAQDNKATNTATAPVSGDKAALQPVTAASAPTIDSSVNSNISQNTINQSPSSTPSHNTSNDSGISVDEFHEEAQTTLYRDDN